MRLISMTDFVIEQIKLKSKYKIEKIDNYAFFLKKHLELWMFVPCNDKGNMLKIIPFNEHKQGSDFEFLQHHYYDKAKERCLFNGLVYDEEMELMKNKNGLTIFYTPTISRFNIEDIVKYSLELTTTAIKKIGLIEN
jgi:hypothetical protein